MLQELYKSGKLYGYICDYWDGGKGVVIADSVEDAKEKVKSAYLKHGYSISDLEDLEVWKVEDGLFDDASDVLEIWQ